jgi:hypothetical protein
VANRSRLLFALILALLAWTRVEADMVVVVNAKSGVERLSMDEVVNIYMGRYRQLPSGLPAVPVDQPDAMPEKARFYRLLVNKDLSEINAYWARLIFSGKTSPPRQARSAAEVVEWVAKQRGGIAYLDRAEVDSRMKIVIELER